VSVPQKPGFFWSHAQNTRTGVWFLRRVPFLAALLPFILRFFRSTAERLMVESFFIHFSAHTETPLVAYGIKVCA
jgi:hypothetical protein